MSALNRAGLLVVMVAAGCKFLPGTLDCTDIGGNDGVSIEVQVNGGTLPPGRYTIIARVGDVELRLEQELRAEGAVTIDGGGDVVVDGKHMFISGALFGSFGSIFVGYREGGGPEMIAIEIRHGDATLAQAAYAPRYSAYYPNGEGCPPELEQAHESIAVTAP